jgi:hypothetical protein
LLEATPTIKEESKKLVDDGDFFLTTDPNLQIIKEENREEKKQTSETHHGFLSTSLCPTPHFPSTLSSLALALKPLDMIVPLILMPRPQVFVSVRQPPPGPPDMVLAPTPAPRPPLKPPCLMNNIWVVNYVPSMGRQTLAQYFYRGQILMDKNYVFQVTYQLNSFGPPQIRPARKPPDLHVNLEDKVQVNPAAMIEDNILLIK